MKIYMLMLQEKKGINVGAIMHTNLSGCLLSLYKWMWHFREWMKEEEKFIFQTIMQASHNDDVIEACKKKRVPQWLVQHAAYKWI